MNEWYNAQMMKLRRSSVGLLRLALGVVILQMSQVFAVPDPEASPDYPTRIFSDISYYDTKANYDINGGSYVGLVNGRYYRLIEGQVGAEHWLSNDFSIFAQIGYARAESYDSVFTRNNSSFTDLVVGGRYVVTRSTVNLIPEAWFSYPFNKFADDTDEVLTGEGVMKGFVGLFAELPFGSIRPFAEVGYLHQADGRASLALYELGLNWMPKGFKIGTKLYGTKVVSNDEYSDQRILRDTVTNRVNGGSWKFYSVDPEVLGFDVHGGIEINQMFRINGTFDKTINGEASAAGWTAIISLEYLFPSDGRMVERSAPRVVSPDVLEPESAADRAFEPDQTDYDKSLFVEPKPKLKPKKKVKRKPRAKPIDVDKSLDDVQRSLEN